MGTGGRAVADGLSGRRFSIEGDLADSISNTERGRGLPRNRSCWGGVEGGGGDTKLPLNRLHHLPRLPPWVSGGTRHGDCNPRYQTASAGYGH